MKTINRKASADARFSVFMGIFGLVYMIIGRICLWMSGPSDIPLHHLGVLLTVAGLAFVIWGLKVARSLYKELFHDA